MLRPMLTTLYSNKLIKDNCRDHMRDHVMLELHVLPITCCNKHVSERVSETVTVLTSPTQCRDSEQA